MSGASAEDTVVFKELLSPPTSYAPPPLHHSVTCLYGDSRIAGLGRSWRTFIVGVCLLTLVCGLLAGATLVATWLIDPSGYRNRFEPFKAIRPGQPVNVLDDTCNDVYLPESDLRQHCEILLPAGPIQKVEVSSQNGKIHGVLFRGRSLQVADLVQHWGRPANLITVGPVHKGQQRYMLQWANGLISDAAAVPPFSFHAEVKLVVWNPSLKRQ